MDRGVQALRAQLQDTTSVVGRVLAQTRARVLKGATHYPDKVLSILEPETEAIRKGKAAKPTEFGKQVKIQEAEGGLITDYAVCPKRCQTRTCGNHPLIKHQELFDRPPGLAVADDGFASAANERAAAALGVDKIVLPRPRGHPTPKQKSPPRRQALRWRTGCEGRISVLKRCHGLRRCRYRGLRGMERWVGLGAIANNLRVLARAAPGARGPKAKR